MFTEIFIYKTLAAPSFLKSAQQDTLTQVCGGLFRKKAGEAVSFCFASGEVGKTRCESCQPDESVLEFRFSGNPKREFWSCAF